jgi:hypothetical protein
MYKFSIRYGLAAGILCGSIMVIAFYSGIPTRGNRFLNISNLIFMYLPSLLTIYSARKVNGGEILFKDAIKIGVSASILTAMVFSLFTATYYYLLNPNFATKYLVDIEISLKQAGITGAELKKQMGEWAADMSAGNQTFKTFFATTIFTTILAAINALILCKKD